VYDSEGSLTWEFLRGLGFMPDPLSSEGLVYDFGNCHLSAYCAMFQPVVHFLVTTNSGWFEFDIPWDITSREECAARIAWILDGGRGEDFRPRGSAAWLELGRLHKHELPWVVELAEYEASPRCWVSREWLRMALKTLAGHLGLVDDGAPVKFEFDGKVLSIRCGDELIVMACDGQTWPTSYAIPAGKLRRLPKRLMRERVCIHIWRSQLTIDRVMYEGIVDLAETVNPPTPAPVVDEQAEKRRCLKERMRQAKERRQQGGPRPALQPQPEPEEQAAPEPMIRPQQIQFWNDLRPKLRD
jgi:hypothetical protein